MREGSGTIRRITGSRTASFDCQRITLADDAMPTPTLTADGDQRCRGGKILRWRCHDSRKSLRHMHSGHIRRCQRWRLHRRYSLRLSDRSSFTNSDAVKRTGRLPPAPAWLFRVISIGIREYAVRSQLPSSPAVQTLPFSECLKFPAY